MAGLSVPLAVASVFVPGKDYRIALASLGVIAFIGACYRVWRHERRRALRAKAILAAGAGVQAELATAELARLKRAQDAEQTPQRWLDGALAALRKPGCELVHVAPGDLLHAQWAVERGHLESLSTSHGTSVILPAAERLSIPGSREARVRAVRQSILTECAKQPRAWFSWEAQRTPLEEWQMIFSATEELDAEGLVTAKISHDAVAMRITPQGSEAARRGTF